MIFFIGLVFGVFITTFIIWLLNQIPDAVAEKSQSTACILAEQYRKMSKIMYQQYLKMKEKCENIEKITEDNDKKTENKN